MNKLSKGIKNSFVLSSAYIVPSFVEDACLVWVFSYLLSSTSLQGAVEGTKTVAYLLDAQTINVKV